MLISFNDVTKQYNLDEEKIITPVNRVNLAIAGGDFTIITGRSGSGKTTLLNLAAGLVRPTTGRILIGGVDIKNMSDKGISLMRNRTMGFIFQYPSLIPSLNAVENVALPCIFHKYSTYSDGYKRAVSLLQTVGLLDRLEARPKQLSAGQQRRVVIARSLINNPTILLADEPTSDLDECTEREIMDLLLKIHTSGTTILMVTHSLELTACATSVFRMENGVLEGSIRSHQHFC
ncbi:MAG: ABC transporter ATP-binding protein [Chloroflexi bacterium]|nr:ABC transporter ATP-binding protein [Chloroflexota bacterium]